MFVITFWETGFEVCTHESENATTVHPWRCAKQKSMRHEDDVVADEKWPVLGTILRVSPNRRQLVLNRTSSLFHAGMYLVARPYEAGSDYEGVDNMRVEEVDLNVVHLAEAAPVGVEGSSFFTIPRAAPENPSDFNRMDCVCVVFALHRDFKSEQFITDRQYRLDIMHIPTDDGTPEAMLAAYRVVIANMNILQEKCAHYKLYNCEGAVEEAVTRMLNEMRTIQNRLFESEYAMRSLERAAAGGPAAGEEDKYISLWNFNMAAEDEKSIYTEILEYFLRVAWQQNLRHRGNIVYERIMTTVDTWKVQPDNGLCTAASRCQAGALYFAATAGGGEGSCADHRRAAQTVERPAAVGMCTFPAPCREYACFAAPGSTTRVRCPKHRAAADEDHRLVEEDGVMRIREEERRSSVEPTQAWRPMMDHGSTVSIHTWLHRNVDQKTQVTLFNKFITSYSQVVKTCVSFMATANSVMFPEFAPDPKKFSFQNGIYDIRENRFMEYGSTQVPDCCCVNHIDEYFDPGWCHAPVASLTIPGYDQIVASQEYTAEVRMWLDVFLGRLFFAVGEFDHWEKFLVVKGYAATGKSTIAKAIVQLFGASNVGNIPANCEEQWALASVYNKRVWLCTELKKDWRFPSAVLQSMISGEVVPVHVKNQTAVDIQWAIQGAAFGNEEPTAWQNDTMNALYRRVILLPFDITPRTQDPTIQKKFMKNTARFLVRLVRTYMTVAAERSSIDDALPPRLKEARAEFVRRTQPLIRFLEETPDIGLAPAEVRRFLQTPPSATGHVVVDSSTLTRDKCEDMRLIWRMRMSEVAARFKDWWIENNLGKVVPAVTSKAVYGTAATHLNLSVERDEAERQDYMYGVKPMTSMRAGHSEPMFGFRGGEGAGVD